MPLDSRRLPVPENSFSPLVLKKDEERKSTPIIDQSSGKRHDGRSETDIRPLFLKTGIVTRARGSAYLEMGLTKIICAVYGPREVTKREDFSMKGQLYCELKIATFANPTRGQHQADSEEKSLSMKLTEALEPAVRLENFPKSRMDIFVTVLQNDGGVLSNAITVSSLALADAGIEMYDIVTGCSLRQQGNVSIVDPTLNEDYSSRKISATSSDDGSVTVGLMPSLHQMSALEQTGKLSSETATKCIRKCTEGCQKLYPVVQACLVDSVKHKTKKKLQKGLT